MILFISILLIVLLTIAAYRKWKLFHDNVLNPDADPYLAFAETERKLNKQLFSPWKTTDPSLLTIAKDYFNDIHLTNIDHLQNPIMTPVKIALLSKEDARLVRDETEYFIAVGGPSAAMTAFQIVKKGQRVLYVNNNDIHSSDKIIRPIWMGAANHGEPDSLTVTPSYISGHHPFKFLWNEFLRLLNPSRYDDAVLRDDYPWLTLNITDWIKNPLQIPAGLRVAWENYRLSHKHRNALDADTIAAALFKDLQKRTHISGKYLEQFNQQQKKILRDPRGALILAPDQQTWSVLLKDIEKLKDEDKSLITITADEALTKYGFAPRNTFAMLEKTQDFIFEPKFFDTITEEIKAHGGEVITHWHLTRILVDVEKNQTGVLEFRETKENGEIIFHYRKFSRAHLSLGSTLFDPNPYDLISVTGVSINALVLGTKLSGGPIICGGTGNHIAVIPLTEPKKTASGLDVNFIRIAAGGCVGPLNRKENWYTYSGRTAVNALHCLRKILPTNSALKVLSVIGCNRVIGKDSRQVEINPAIKVSGEKITIESITLQLGAAGGGLTQMAALADQENILE